MAVDRQHAERKGATMVDVLHSDLGRLAETHARGYPQGIRALSWAFYTWRRLMGTFLIRKIPRALAFTRVRKSRWAIFRRQALSCNKA